MILPHTPEKHSHVKLADVDDAQEDVFRLERRHSVRHHAAGRVTALSKGVELNTHTNRICALQLVDISDHGLGAITQEPLEIGSQISIFFPSHGADWGFDLHGQIVRCVHREQGHEVGIRFVAKHAA